MRINNPLGDKFHYDVIFNRLLIENTLSIHKMRDEFKLVTGKTLRYEDGISDSETYYMYNKKRRM